MNSSEPRGHLTYIPGVGEVRVTLLANLEAAERRAIEAEGRMAEVIVALKDHVKRAERAQYFRTAKRLETILAALSDSDSPVAGEAQEQALPITDEVRAALLKLVHRTEHEAGCGTESSPISACTCGLSDAISVVADCLHSTTKDPEEGR